MRLAFLVYSNRSGSTYLASRLARVPGVAVSIESTFISLLLEAGVETVDVDALLTIEGVLKRDPKLSGWSLNADRLADRVHSLGSVSFQEAVHELLATEFGDDREVVIVKDPRITRNLSRAMNLLPDALFIHVLRDPRGVISSQLRYRSSLTGMPMAPGAYYGALAWRRAFRAAMGIPAQRIHHVQFEELVAEEARQIRAICDFLGIGYTGMTSATDASGYADRIPDSQKHLHRLVGGSADQSRVEAWRNELSDTDIYVIERLLRQELSQLGLRPVSSADTHRPWALGRARTAGLFARVLTATVGMARDSSRRSYYSRRLRQRLGVRL